MNRVLILLAMTAAAGRADSAKLQEFYIVTASSTDYIPGGADTLLHAWQDGVDTLVRYVNIEYVNASTPRPLVQAAETRMHNMSPANLVKGAYLCAVNQGTLDAAVKKLGKTPFGGVEYTGLGVVARCGTRSVVLRLPSKLLVDQERLAQAYPGFARLWKLDGEIIEAAFGSGHIFHDSAGKNNLSQQDEGERLVPELRSGLHDAGLAVARKAGTGNPADSTFRFLLEHYRGPVTQEDTEKRPVPRLVDADAYRFTQFAAPQYPANAMQPRVEGRVKLRLTVEPATGEVRGASAVSGHPLLCPSAEEAAKRWRLEPGSVSAGTVEVTLEYALWD